MESPNFISGSLHMCLVLPLGVTSLSPLDSGSLGALLVFHPHLCLVQRGPVCGRWSSVAPLSKKPHPLACPPRGEGDSPARMTDGTYPTSRFLLLGHPITVLFVFLSVSPPPSPLALPFQDKAFQIIKYLTLLIRGLRWLYRGP